MLKNLLLSLLLSFQFFVTNRAYADAHTQIESLKLQRVHNFMSGFYSLENRENIYPAMVEFFSKRGMSDSNFLKDLKDFKLKSLVKQTKRAVFEISIGTRKSTVELKNIHELSKLAVKIDDIEVDYNPKEDSLLSLIRKLKAKQKQVSFSPMDVFITKSHAFPLPLIGLAFGALMAATPYLILAAENSYDAFYKLGGNFCCKMVDESIKESKALTKRLNQCILELGKVFSDSISFDQAQSLSTIQNADSSFPDEDSRLYRIARRYSADILSEESSDTVETCEKQRTVHNQTTMDIPVENDAVCVKKFKKYRKKYTEELSNKRNLFTDCIDVMENPMLRKDKLFYNDYLNSSRGDMEKIIKTYDEKLNKSKTKKSGNK